MRLVQASSEVDLLLSELQTKAPWVPCCLVCPPIGPKPFARVDQRHSVILDAGHATSAELAQLALRAISRRPVPPSVDLARWIASRLERDAWVSDLTAAMSPAVSDESPSVARAIRRRLNRISRLTRHEWRRLAMLARLPRHGLGVDRLALEAGINPDYFRRWTTRLLGLAARTYRHLPGWEPVLELGLRKAGLIRRWRGVA